MNVLRPPGPDERSPAAAPPPRPVRISRWLWISGALLSAGRSLVRLADRRELVDQLRQASPALGQDEVDAAVSGTVLLGLLLSALVVGGYVLLANRMARGVNWARFVLAAFGAASVLFGALGLVAALSGVADSFGLHVRPVDLLLGTLGVLIDATALVLMFLPAVGPYFQRRLAASTSEPAPR